MNTNEKRIEVLQRADHRDAERYRKLRAWLMHDYPTLGLGPTVIDTRWKGSDAFDAGVDTLPEPIKESNA